MNASILIDIGNTNFKWCRYENGRLDEIKRIPLNGNFRELLDKAFSDISPCPVLVAAVAGCSGVEALRDWIRQQWQQEIVELKSERERCGVRNGYEEPASLGVDRWLNLIGARRMSQSPLVVVSCGTALTIDFLDAGGTHEGGLIVPGLSMMAAAVFDNTGIPPVPVSLPTQYHLGDSTSTAIENGSLAAVAGAVNLALDQYAGPGHGQILLLTGGDAENIRPYVKGEVELVPDLVFKGMACYVDEI